jgi:hypothetical protein
MRAVGSAIGVAVVTTDVSPQRDHLDGLDDVDVKECRIQHQHRFTDLLGLCGAMVRGLYTNMANSSSSGCTPQEAMALARADDVLLACPLTDRTRNLLSRDRLWLLRKGARGVNIARGPVWDQEAVCDALEAGHLE